MFCHLGTTAGSNESGCSGDIEELAAAAAGTASVYDYLAFDRHLGGKLAHCNRCAGDLFGRFAFDT